jgi:calcineurin-like phosphoesterase family protein
MEVVDMQNDSHSEPTAANLTELEWARFKAISNTVDMILHGHLDVPFVSDFISKCLRDIEEAA